MKISTVVDIRGHSFSTYARRGGGGVKQMRTNAYKGGRGG